MVRSILAVVVGYFIFALSAVAFFQLSGRIRALRIPAWLPGIEKVMEAVLLLCPQAEIDPETRAVLDLLGSGLESKTLPALLQQAFLRYARKHQLDASATDGYFQFHASRENQAVFIRQFIEEQRESAAAAASPRAG